MLTSIEEAVSDLKTVEEQKAETSDNNIESSASTGENRNYTADDIVEYLKTDQPKYEETDSDNGEKGTDPEDGTEAGAEGDTAEDSGSKDKKQKKTLGEKWEAFKEKIINLKDKFFELKDKASKIKYIWDAPVTKRALAYIKVLALKLLRHIKPRKIRGYVRFGMDDPGNTALIYGFSAYLAGIMDKHFHVIPEMEEKIIDTDVVIKGRIFIGYMVVLALKFLLNNDITRVRRYIRRNF
ncbi:MAG: DUF2953 domain-containing protein [Parasporobacterium sp.]|nr:DUF2953 domain-containing protein [Parasporobacterium sp.]